MIRLIEMWKENIYERPASLIKFDNPELYSLTKYLNDDNLKHYRQNPTQDIPSFTYNNGKTSEVYYIGVLSNIEFAAKLFYIEHYKKHPKLILRYPEKLPQWIKFNDLLNLVLNHLGFNRLYFDQSVIKPYYPVPPLKLKTGQIMDNNSDLDRLKQIDVDIVLYEDKMKLIEKNIKFHIRHIEKHNKILNDLQTRLGVLKIRAEQVKNVNTKYNDVQQKISEYTRSIELYQKEQDEHVSTKNNLENDLTKLKNKLNEYSDEYTDIINKLDSINSDKTNYEYSNQQLKDAKDAIQKNVVSNPLSWIQKLHLTPEKILELVDLNKMGDVLFGQLVKNVKSFGPYKYVGSITENKTDYYIFTNEINRNSSRK
jgi:hypothetical protein